MSRLEIVPCTLREARAFVERTHRHHPPPQGGRFAVGVAQDGRVVGVAIVGNPTARLSCDGWRAEVTRVATDGTRNACSMLYGACWRAARALGFREIITFTLPQESGASLRGAGFKSLGTAGGGAWSREGRPRVDLHPLQVKMKWSRNSG